MIIHISELYADSKYCLLRPVFAKVQTEYEASVQWLKNSLKHETQILHTEELI